MEEMRSIPVHRRFGVRVFLFIAILLVSMIVPALVIWNLDYGQLLDRTTFQSLVFQYCEKKLRGLSFSEWPAVIAGLSELLPLQRVIVLDSGNELMYDSGVFPEPRWARWEPGYPLLFPNPYVNWPPHTEALDPAVLVRCLREYDIANKAPANTALMRNRSIEYAQGIDRVLYTARKIPSASGEDFVLVLSSSLVDILIHGRFLKERFLMLCSVVVACCLALSLMLSRTVTGPLKRLYLYSRNLASSNWRRGTLPELTKRDEIGAICQALQGLIKEQKTQSDNFMKFSSDIVHELKTPLATIRSGLEVYSESTDPKEKEEIYIRINKRIQQMENLMSEIQDLAGLESRGEEECTDNVLGLVEEVRFEFKEPDIAIDIHPGIEGIRMPLSSRKIYQIITNLLKNAVSFSPEKNSVALSLYTQDGAVCIHVRDKGPGIPEEALSHITERFYSYRTDVNEKHSGLGLSIVEAILSSCNGRLSYSNLKEGGAEFTCRIPIVSE